jgi:hypothetical protein
VTGISYSLAVNSHRAIVQETPAEVAELAVKEGDTAAFEQQVGFKFILRVFRPAFDTYRAMWGIYV